MDKAELNSKFAYWRTIEPKKEELKIKRRIPSKEYWPRNISKYGDAAIRMEEFITLNKEILAEFVT